jgi:UDP-N-acetylglucosamine 2-epimerase (non-hydrolysing)
MKVPKTVMMVDPVGYEEFLILMTHSLGVLTDSGTVAEEACILQVPCVQLRKSTERPQVYDVGACVKFDPTDIASYSLSVVYGKLEALRGRRWSNPFGDGNASERITSDIVARIESSQLTHHRSSDFRLSIAHAFRDDALDKMLGIPTTRDIVGV